MFFKYSICDLEFCLLPTLSVKLHIQEICCKGFIILKLTKRISSEFKLKYSLKSLHSSFVSSIFYMVVI